MAQAIDAGDSGANGTARQGLPSAEGAALSFWNEDSGRLRQPASEVGEPRSAECRGRVGAARRGTGTFDGLRDLPHFNPDIESSGVPESVLRWRQALVESHAVLIASPEYGFSLPGALKNGIDWVIGSGELEGKIVAITAAVPAPERGRRGLQALCDTLSAVRATIVGGEPLARGPEFEPRVAALVRALVEAAGGLPEPG